MSENKIELILSKKSNGTNIDISAMSLEESQSFLIIFESLIKIIELSPDSAGVKIQIRSGSAVAEATGTAEQITKVQNEFDDVVNHRSVNKELVNKWGNLQDLFKKNGLGYEANIVKDSQRISIFTTIKSANKFKPKIFRPRIVSDTNISFICGKLIEAGGKKPNIHLLDEDENRFTVGCSQVIAKRASIKLYDTFFISAWEKKREGHRSFYEFCDFYSEEVYADFKLFMEGFMADEDEISALKKLHYKCKSIVEANNLEILYQFMKLFYHTTVDMNVLKTILVITKGLKDEPDIKAIRERIRYTLDEKLTDYNKKNTVPF